MVIAKKKVKKPLMNNTIKNMDFNWSPGPEPPNNTEAGVPRAIFIPHSNSLPFEERRVTLEQPVKIGRNVYRATPSPTNIIFECRVLSRHHATLYYDRGHFYLVDNQSSNGTFINNNRCSISKDQEPHEVFSGDIVQFGIQVVENAANAEKNTFPPVVALLQLYHPDGKEAKMSFNPTMSTPLHLKELYQLNNFVQEAIQREAALEGRLRTMREWVERTSAEARSSWELFVGEQRLLMRVHTLETMHAVGRTPEPHHLAQLLNDKRNYQEVAQESLRAAHEQRLALEESLERRNRDAQALHHHNCALRLAATNALAELQKLAARCERKMCAARLAIAAAEERERLVRAHLPLAYSVANGEARMLVVSADKGSGAAAGKLTLEDAVRALPDYIKLLLPQQLLAKVGIKVLSAEDKTAKELDMILKRNDLVILKKTDSNKKMDEDETGNGGGEDGAADDADICTDDEKQSRLNHDSVEGGPLSADGEPLADNNANSTYGEPDNRDTDDTASLSGVEYANILRVMGGLNEEIKALRSRLAAADAEAAALRNVRDELLAAAPDAPPASDGDDAPPPDAGDADPAEQEDDYRARITDLQAQLSRSSVAEEANLAEIQRLAASAAEIQAELAFRPTRQDLDQLGAVVEQLRADLQLRDSQIERLQRGTDDSPPISTADKSVAASPEDLRERADEPIDPGKISAEIDEMFRLDFDDDDEETDSAATAITRDYSDATVGVSECADGGDTSSTGAAEAEAARLALALANGSWGALEQELVLAKERWEQAQAERARLAAQLAALRRKPPLNTTHVLALVVPIAAAAIFYLLLPYLS